MITRLAHLTWMAILLAVLPSFALTHYVDVNSSNPVAPYTNWTTAANVIQDAVDAATNGDTILVTNGVYDTGGKAVSGLMTNRVAVDKPLTLLSVNGPEVTVIEGHQVPGTINGDGAVRCVYLIDGAMMSGFTLTNGATRSFGDAFQEQHGGGVWCASTHAWVSNCVMVGNTARLRGGGAHLGSFNRCLFMGNLAGHGGGAVFSTLTECILSNNQAGGDGGGTHSSTLTRCRLFGNQAGGDGGGAYIGRLSNCALSRNRAGEEGGGAYRADMNNCTITGNSAGKEGGGIYQGTVNNSIIYFNSAGSAWGNYRPRDLNYCCTSPLPPSGIGNFDLDPLLASPSHLSTSSPCREAGDLSLTTGMDIDGEGWASPPSVGCDEYIAGAVTGAIAAHILASYTNIALGSTVDFVADIQGRTTASEWDFGDGTILTNQPYAAHEWAIPGDYDVVLRGFNESWPSGVSATVTVHVVSNPLHYVSLASTNPAPPFMSWATAATNIQDAVDAAFLNGTVLVSNGVYATGGRTIAGGMTNRVAVDKPLDVASVNGPESTVIQGYQMPGLTNGDAAVRCVYLAAGASIRGFKLIEGATQDHMSAALNRQGGGVWCESTNAWISNCVIMGNSANTYGGGVYGGTIVNSALTGNQAQEGGGMYESVAFNCTVTGNFGGGSYRGVLKNCIVYFNSGREPWHNHSSSSMSYCCTTPQPSGGTSITVDPQLASASHLSANSPCRGAGNASFAAGTDLDSEAWASPPSIGCDEFWPGDVAGDLTVSIHVSDPEPEKDVVISLRSDIIGRTTSSFWNLGDGTAMTNQPFVSHAWDAAGDYPVVLTAYNETWPGGVSATVIVHVVYTPFHYVSVGNTNSVTPYTNWATASTTIQDAVDVSFAGDTVLVADGVYSTGGRAVHGSMTNRVVVDRPIELRSLNGPEHTTVRGHQIPGSTNGDGAIRCVYLTSGASLSGFTLTNGATRISGDSKSERSGGGLFAADYTSFVSNCVLVGSSADSAGGGIYGGTMDRCLLASNVAFLGGGSCWARISNSILLDNMAQQGGGANSGTLNNCLLVGNSADQGGGAHRSTLNSCTVAGNSAASTAGGVALTPMNNCIVFFNTAPSLGNENHWSASGNYCCSLPALSWGNGHITNTPLFVNTNSWVDLRLQSNSPCVNAGDNSSVTAVSDLDGNPRIVGGTVDMGTYENTQGSTTNGLPWAWLLGYGLATDGSTDFIDSDFDNANTWQEWKAWTDPTNALSVLKMLMPDYIPSSILLSWNSEAGADYWIEVANGSASPGSFSVLKTNIPGQVDRTYARHPGAGHAGAGFYRVGTLLTNLGSPIVLKMPEFVEAEVTVEWNSIAGQTYHIERATNPSASYTLLQSNIVGQAGSTSFTDTNVAGSGPHYYRVGVPE